MRARRIVVAGTAGGVGTTTATALLFSMLRNRTSGAPRLLDHTGGDLARRVLDSRAARLDEELTLHDLGPLALTAGVAQAGAKDSTLVVVSAATPAGCLLAGRCLDLLLDAHGPTVLARTRVVLDAALGRYRLRRPLRELRADREGLDLVLLPRDRALTSWKPVDTVALGRRTRSAAGALALGWAD